MMAIGECTDQNWINKRRQELVDKYWHETKYFGPVARKTFSRDERRKHNQLWDEALNNYNAEISLIEVSRCPICNEKLYYGMDSLGLDSPWWDTDHPDEEKPKLQACSHFRTLLGAINFHGRDPVEADCHPAKRSRNIKPGPGVPFVVPHVLTHSPGMVAVISSFTSPQGDTYYPIAYFSPKPISPGDSYQPWARETLKIFGDDGELKGWTVLKYEWDFELQPWIDKKQIAWINPNEDKVVTEGVCPYVGIQGIRQPQLIEHGTVKTLHLPDGKPYDPTGD